MLCTKCGATNPDNTAFCSACAQPLGATAGAAAPLSVFDAGYAGFWRRYAATFLDGLVVSLMLLPVAFVGGLLAGVLGLGKSIAIVGLILYALFCIGYAAYYVVMESGERGATFGKRWVKIRVVDMQGNRVSTGRALGRFVAHLLSYMTGYLGFIIQPFTPRKQALHDMVSGTVIVKTEKDPSPVVVVLVAIANALLVVAVVGVMAAIAIRAYQEDVAKTKITAAAQIGDTASKAVEGYYRRTGRVPASIAETQVQLTTPPFVSAVEVNPANGEVHVTFAGNLPAAIAGKYLSFVPSVAADETITWTCSANDIPPELLPEDCQ